MEFNWTLFFSALGLAFVIEGVAYFLLPTQMHAAWKTLLERPPSTLRWMGMGGMLFGVLILLLAL